MCIVTGAARGIGRAYARMLGAEGASVVVNDVGSARDGSGGDTGTAQDVADEISAAGGTAVANTDDISTWAGGETIACRAIEIFGGLDVVANNAGILRDRMLFSMTEEEWDSVVAVHLKGTFATSRHAAAYWRERYKAGETNDARIINTTSVAGLYANPGQTNYGAAKAGIAAFTRIAAQELSRIGATVNAIAPGALTRLTEDLSLPEEVTAKFEPAWVAPVVTWLASPQSADITGQVIESSGLVLAIAEGWHRGPSTEDVPTEPRAVDAIVASSWRMPVRAPRWQTWEVDGRATQTGHPASQRGVRHEVIVVKAAISDVELECGGALMVPTGEDPREVVIDPARAEGTLIGKRYVHDAGLEVLCTKGGAGSLSVDGAILPQKDTRPLPSSD